MATGRRRSLCLTASQPRGRQLEATSPQWSRAVTPRPLAPSGRPRGVAARVLAVAAQGGRLGGVGRRRRAVAGLAVVPVDGGYVGARGVIPHRQPAHNCLGRRCGRGHQRTGRAGRAGGRGNASCGRGLGRRGMPVGPPANVTSMATTPLCCGSAARGGGTEETT